MMGSKEKPDILAAYRELESITISLLASVEREEIDAMLAEIGRREEIQGRMESFEAEDIASSRDDILPILERIRAMDDEIEPMMFDLMAKVGEKIRSASNSRKLLSAYIKEPEGLDAKFFDRRG